MKSLNFLAALLYVCATAFGELNRSHVAKRALQKSHEKPQAVKWYENLVGKDVGFDHVESLVSLLNMLAVGYLKECTTVILYDSSTEKSGELLLEQLFGRFPYPYVHGQISARYRAKASHILTSNEKCVSYILFMADVMRCKDVIGEKSTNRVIVIARSSQWRVYEFLASEVAQNYINLLVISKSDKIVANKQEQPYILYTHRLYIDGLGSSAPQVLTSWYRGAFTRPHVNLFPPKMTKGFAGHRFIVSLANQQPFVIKKSVTDDDEIVWDGAEVRLIHMLAQIYNFTTDFREAKQYSVLGSADAVAEEVRKKKANIGIAGMYITQEMVDNLDVSHAHSRDCAAFISLTSTALPRYRAIMGPFHWTVWLALTLVYLFAIFPLAYSDRLTLKHLLKTPEEVENMFWYVFGTFTNCFTFSSNKSWSKTDKITTRLLIGFYWLFTIIVTACYTGSIIAFVTLPVYPTTVDTPAQLLSKRFQIGTLDKGGWQYWYQNSSDPITAKLFKKIEYIPTVEDGLRNTTKAFFWPYAFLGSRAQLDYIVRTNFTTTNKRSLLHIGSECFVPYDVALVYPYNSIHKDILDKGILAATQNGMVVKMRRDVEWEIMRSATGKLLSASYGGGMKTLTVEDRALTLDDTQGMFLLLGAGFLFGAGSFVSEILGGCFNFCKRKRGRSSTSIMSNRRSFDVPTPREKLDSIQYNNIGKHHRLKSISDAEHIAENNVNANHVKNIPADLIVHNHVQAQEAEGDSDFEEEIDKLFNFDMLFGEQNSMHDEKREEIVSDATASDKQNGN